MSSDPLIIVLSDGLTSNDLITSEWPINELNKPVSKFHIRIILSNELNARFPFGKKTKQLTPIGLLSTFINFSFLISQHRIVRSPEPEAKIPFDEDANVKIGLS